MRARWPSDGKLPSKPAPWRAPSHSTSCRPDRRRPQATPAYLACRLAVALGHPDHSPTAKPTVESIELAKNPHKAVRAEIDAMQLSMPDAMLIPLGIHALGVSGMDQGLLA
jgi:hypothetical protein